MVITDINEHLKKYLPKGNSIIKKAIQYSVFSGGKRIRPIITMEAAKICGANFGDAIPAACAIEFIHTYSLIHDDLPAMDNDDFRRGKPTCHKVFGEANAILAGDALLTLAFGVVAGHMDPSRGSAVIKELSDAVGTDGMVGGQSLDMEFQGKSKNEKITKKINLLKTAKLFEVAAKIGAISVSANTKEVKALQRFGLYFGLSFQMVDDFLDGECSDRRKALLFMNKAVNELKIFGDKANRLKKISKDILNRTK